MHAPSFEPAPPVPRAALYLLRMTPMSWFSCLDLTSAGVRIVHRQVAWFCPLLLGLKSICNYCSVRKIIESTCVFCFLNTLQASRPNLVSLFFCSAGEQTQDCAQARQACCHQLHLTLLSCYLYNEESSQ